MRPTVLAALRSCSSDVAVLRSRYEIDRSVASLPRTDRPGGTLAPALVGTHF